MSDFLSRLVERTFSLVKVAQPVIGSIFSPESSVRSVHPLHETNSYGSVRDNGYFTDRKNVNINSSQKTGIIPKSDDQPALRREKPLTNHDLKPFESTVEQIGKTDSEPDFSPINLEISANEFDILKPESPTDNQALVKYNSGALGHIGRLSLNQLNVRNNRYSHKQPGELTQENEKPYKTASDTKGSVPFEEQSSVDEQTSQNGPSFDKRGSQKPEIVSSKRAENGFSHPVGLQENPDIKQSNKIEQNFSSNDLFFGNTTYYVEKEFLEQVSNSSPMSGSPASLRKNVSIHTGDEPISDMDFYQSGHRHSDTLLPINPTIQNSNSVNAQEANEALRQMGKLLIEPHAVAPRSTTITPTVKVTIGRIEVRAIKPPHDPLTLAPQQQIPFPPRQQPILSLDEYLKQHNG